MSRSCRDGDIVTAFFAGEYRKGIVMDCDGILYVFFPYCNLGCLINNVVEILGNVHSDPSLLRLVV